MKRQLMGKTLDAGKDWRQKEKRKTEDEMVGWHHQFNGNEFEQTSGDHEGQGSLMCCSPWGRKESDTTEWLIETTQKEWDTETRHSKDEPSEQYGERNKPDTKGRTVGSHLYEMSRTGKHTEQKVGWQLPREEEYRVALNEYGVSFWGDENVVTLDCGDGFINLRVC